MDVVEIAACVFLRSPRPRMRALAEPVWKPVAVWIMTWGSVSLYVYLWKVVLEGN